MAMVTIDGPFMVLVLILQTIQSKSCMVIFKKTFIQTRTTYFSYSCDYHWSDLDSIEAGGQRAHKLTETLFDALGTKSLWNDYGIVDGILVWNLLS